MSCVCVHMKAVRNGKRTVCKVFMYHIKLINVKEKHGNLFNAMGPLSPLRTLVRCWKEITGVVAAAACFHQSVAIHVFFAC